MEKKNEVKHEQIPEELKQKYPKEFSPEEIEEVLKELFINEDMFVKELTPTEIIEAKKVFGNFVFSNMGKKLFRLPGGAITGIGGVEQFNKAMVIATQKFLK